jgi:hypothetical protein
VFEELVAVLRESELEVILYNLATVKERGGVGIIPILDMCMAASLTCVHHNCVCMSSHGCSLSQLVRLSSITRTPTNQHDTPSR